MPASPPASILTHAPGPLRICWMARRQWQWGGVLSLQPVCWCSLNVYWAGVGVGVEAGWARAGTSAISN